MAWNELRLVVAHAPLQAMEQTRRRDQQIETLIKQGDAWAGKLDGKLLLVTNTQDLSAQEVLTRYKALADIERGFRVLKSDLEIAPVYHRLPERIRAHATVCFMALILYRVMRQRLKAAETGLSPERALEYLRRIQHHQVRLDASEPVAGVSTLNAEQTKVHHALAVTKPSLPQQPALL